MPSLCLTPSEMLRAVFSSPPALLIDFSMLLARESFLLPRTFLDVHRGTYSLYEDINGLSVLLTCTSGRPDFASFPVRRVSEPSMGHAIRPLPVVARIGFSRLQVSQFGYSCKSAKGVVLDLALLMWGRDHAGLNTLGPQPDLFCRFSHSLRFP
jgi:hypothetical protein